MMKHPERSHCPDYASDTAFMRRFYNAALEIASRKCDEVLEDFKKIKTVIPLKPRLGMGGGFSGFFLWDTAFCTLWARYAPERYPVLDSLDNFYMLQDIDGFIHREYTAEGREFWARKHPVSFAPPLLSWAERELYEGGISDKARLETVCEPLRRHHAFCRDNFRRDDGMYFGDALGSGMDDIPRTPVGAPYDAHGGIDMTIDCINPWSRWFWESIEGNDLYCWNRQAGWIDMSSQMAFDALNLAAIADELGRADEAAAYRDEHAELAGLINEKCYDQESGFYFDYWDGGLIKRYHAGAFWPLIAGVVPPERVERYVAVIRDPRRFNRPVPFPSLSADDPDYTPETGYWTGAVWPPTTYTLLRGLRQIGEEELAVEFARRYYNANAHLFERTGTIWENLSAEQCERPKEKSGDSFCGWGALAPISIAHEFLGFTP